MASLQDTFLKIVNYIFGATGGKVNASITGTTVNVLSSVIAEHTKSQEETLLLEIDEQFIDTAKQDDSIIRLTTNLGLSRKPATLSSGYITVQGTVGVIIPTETQFINNQNVVYKSLQDTTITFSSLSVLSIVRVANVVTVTTGTNHNLASNITVDITGVDQDELNGTNLSITVTGLNTFTYNSTGSDMTGTGVILTSFTTASIEIESLTGGVSANLSSGSYVSLFNVLEGVDTLCYVQHNGIIGGSDVETIASLQQRGIQAQQIFSSNVTGEAFDIDKLSILLVQNTIATRAWVYQAQNNEEAGFITTVSVNDNQNPITLNFTQLTEQLDYLKSIAPAHVPINNITTLTVNLKPINIAITDLINNTISMRQTIKQELINFFQTNGVIVRVLESNIITQSRIRSVIDTTVDMSTNTRPIFANATITGIESLINDNDLPILGILTINGSVV